MLLYHCDIVLHIVISLLHIGIVYIKVIIFFKCFSSKQPILDIKIPSELNNVDIRK